MQAGTYIRKTLYKILNRKDIKNKIKRGDFMSFWEIIGILLQGGYRPDE